MRTSIAILFGCAVLAAVATMAVAADEDPGPKVHALREALARGAPAAEAWEAYTAARKALDAYAEAHPDQAEDDPATAAFDALTREAAAVLEPDAAKALKELETISADEQAVWADKWAAYNAAKDELEKAEGDRPEAAEKMGPASDYYALIRGQVAAAVRRENLSASGWLMGFFGAVLLWGGFAFCVGVARKANRQG